MPSNLVVIGAAVAAAAVLFVLARILFRPVSGAAGFAQDYSTVDLTRYRPMLRLLEPAEMEFLRRSTPPGSDLARRVRRQHVRLFLAYLRALRADFELVQAAGRYLVAQGVAQPGMAAALFRAHAQFSRSVWILRFRLAGAWLGVGSVDARAVLGAFECAAGALAQPTAA